MRLLSWCDRFLSEERTVQNAASLTEVTNAAENLGPRWLGLALPQ